MPSPCMCLPATVSTVSYNTTRKNSSAPDTDQQPQQTSHASSSSSATSTTTSTSASPIDSQTRYVYIKDIGKGSFGRVILAHDTHHEGRQVAIKLVARRKYNQYTEREVENHLQLIHPHIIRLYDVFLTDQDLALVLEYADQGDLYSFLVQHRRLSEAGARWLIQQVAIALDFLHRSGISLRDLKLENILLRGSPTKPIVKLCDMGFSKSDVLHSAPDSTVGTLAYTAPEIITGKVYDGKQTDAWALGVLLFVLIAGAYPFERSADKDLHPTKRQRMQMQRIIKCELRDWPSLVPTPSEECMDLLKGLLTVDPKKRTSIAQALKHPWMVQGLPKGALEMNNKYNTANPSTPLPRHIINVLKKARDANALVPTTKQDHTRSSTQHTDRHLVKPSVSSIATVIVPDSTAPSTASTSTTTSPRAAVQRSVLSSRDPTSSTGTSPPGGRQVWRPTELLAVYDSLVSRLTSASKRRGGDGGGFVTSA